MKKKKVALKSLKLDKAHLLNLNAIEGGRGVDGKSIIKLTTDDSILPTGPTNPTNATWLSNKDSKGPVAQAGRAFCCFLP